MQLDAELLALAAQPLSAIEPEFRLYYDDSGRVICYTTEQLSGKYIVITAEQYSEARPDVLVIRNRIVTTHKLRSVWKLEKNSVVFESARCSSWDVNIIVPETETDSVSYRRVVYDL